MSELSRIRDEFLESSCPTRASKDQINDMGMAFDAGCTIVLNMILEITGLPEYHAEAKLLELTKEIEAAALLHSVS